MTVQRLQRKVFVNRPAGQDHISRTEEAGHSVYASIQVDWVGLTGTLDATVHFEVSNNDGKTWMTKTGALLTIDTANGTAGISLNNVLTEEKIRAVYSHNGVTGGTIDAVLILKG